MPVDQLSPSSVTLIERATTSVSAVVKDHDTSTKLYDTTPGSTNPTQMNTTTYNKFEATFTLTVGGSQGQQILGGYIYLPVVTGLTVSSASASWLPVVGSVPTVQDSTGAVTGLTGYQFVTPTMSAGNSYSFTVFLQSTSSLSDSSTTNYVLNLHDAGSIENPTYRTWSDATCTITYKAV